MAKLSKDELQELIASADPNIVVDDAPRTAKTPPPDVRTMADRAALAAKVARYRGVDAQVAETPPLTDDQSQFFDERMETPEGDRKRKAAIISTTTGDIIAEQG